jgi:hypothetical protein
MYVHLRLSGVQDAGDGSVAVDVPGNILREESAQGQCMGIKLLCGHQVRNRKDRRLFLRNYSFKGKDGNFWVDRLLQEG